MNRPSETLNAQCLCLSLHREKLIASLAQDMGPDAAASFLDGIHSTVIAEVPVFIDRDDVARMADIIAAVEAVAKTDAYRQAVLRYAPDIACYEPGAIGVLMGYDFHLGAQGPKLIEINTNAGGAMINAHLSAAQAACCGVALTTRQNSDVSDAPATVILNSFVCDWRRQRGDQPLKTIAIVDDDPENQFFYPELLLFKSMFERGGVDSLIAPPEALQLHDEALWIGSTKIDLIYNRLTDFGFTAPCSAALRSAYLAGAVVVTPNPHAHALLADKRNLAFLSDEVLLRSWGISEDRIRLLTEGIPKTRRLDASHADEFWAARRKLFFKPARGYGSKAAYRGANLTRRVWHEILQGTYVAQELVPPSARNVKIGNDMQTMKVDIRNYTYDGTIQLTAARLYRGQTTNMRTPGGGFSPAFATSLPGQCTCDTGSDSWIGSG